MVLVGGRKSGPNANNFLKSRNPLLKSPNPKEAFGAGDLMDCLSSLVNCRAFRGLSGRGTGDSKVCLPRAVRLPLALSIPGSGVSLGETLQEIRRRDNGALELFIKYESSEF